MTEFGHFHASGAGVHIDAWGAGPFVINASGRQIRFEDSERFGPCPVNARGDPTGYFLASAPFWDAWKTWKRQGRRVADDGVTCVYDFEENLR